jgi:hypothetical protein
MSADPLPRPEPARPRPVAPRRPTTGPLTLAECRAILGPTCKDTDDEIRENRDRLMALARALVESRELG